MKVTLEEFRRGVRRAAAEGVEFGARRELVGETKVRYLYVHLAVQQEILRLERSKEHIVIYLQDHFGFRWGS